MKVPKITYLEFLQLPEEKRIELQEIVFVAKVIEVDCQSFTWGKVKDLQSMLEGEITYQLIFDIAQMEGKKIAVYTPFHVVLGLFNSIKKGITDIKEKEEKALAYQPKPKEIQAADEVGGFEMFGSLPQTLKLTQLLNCSYNEVNAMDWATCFSSLVFDKVSKEYDQKVLTS